MHPLKEFESTQLKSDLPGFKAGDTLRVHCKIKEGNKERIQIFEGVVIARHNRGTGSSFTVRKVSHGVGVERVFPLHAPFIEKIEVVTVGKVRQSRIYYLRALSGKKARIAAVDTRGRGQNSQNNGQQATQVASSESKTAADQEEKKEPASES